MMREELDQEIREKALQLEQINDPEIEQIFYENTVFPLIRRKFREHESSKITENYNALILSVGKYYQPLILSLEAIQPKKVYFLYTSETEMYLDTIVEALQLKPSQYQKEEVDAVNPTPIYEAIKKVDRNKGDGKIAVDFTGGTKSMSGGMAMAGGLVGADIFYIASKWNKTLRKPEPGTESIEKIINPYELFGDIDLKRAQELWLNGEYMASSIMFQQLADKLPERVEYQVYNRLGKAYAAWESLHIKHALEHFNWVKQTGKVHLERQSSNAIQTDGFQIIEKQVQILETIQDNLSTKPFKLEALQNRNFMKHLILSFYSIGVRREEQKKLDVATLYLYRMIEMLLQHRSALQGIISHEPDYTVLPMKEEVLLERANEILSQRKLEKWSVLPYRIALIDNHILLMAIGDKVASVVHPSKLRHVSEARNFSILAHGFEIITEKVHQDLKDVAKSFLHAFLKENEEDLESVLLDYEFISPRTFHLV